MLTIERILPKRILSICTLEINELDFQFLLRRKYKDQTVVNDVTLINLLKTSFSFNFDCEIMFEISTRGQRCEIARSISS